MAGSKKTGRLIRYKRNEMGMTQDQLSKIINFTPAAISAWENGVRYPGPDAQLGLYNALGLNAVELLVGLEMFDEDLKKKIAAFMDRIDGKIAEHLDQISALIKRLMSDIENDDGDAFAAVLVLIALLSPFAYVMRQHSALYFYENDGELMPGNYEEWVKTIASVARSKTFRDKLTYYINLKTNIPFKDKMLLSRDIGSGMIKILSNFEYVRRYIESHSKEEYLSIEDQIRQKTESRDYYISGRNVVFFLGNSKMKETE